MPKTSQRHFLVTIAGIAGTFARSTGGNTQAAASESYDGGSDVPETLAGPAKATDLTISRDWDPERDAPLARQLHPVVGKWRTTVTKQPTDADHVPVGEPTVYPGALLLQVNEPETDAGSSAFARLELVFSVTLVK